MDASNINRRILFVDDEPNVLSGMERNLFGEFDVYTATSGSEALEVIEDEDPFSVIVSDMRMPEMNGATFLSKARECTPDTVRILLTGQADVESSIAAVNEGQIFRFLCKPCPSEVLHQTLEDAVEQYRLVHLEKDLLDRTLQGAVKVLTDVMSLGAPVAFSRAHIVRGYVAHMVKVLEIEDGWQYEIAALLSQIGCITLPADTLDRVHAGQPISAAEKEMILQHPQTGQRLLASIPRLERVAEMIGCQSECDHDHDHDEQVQQGVALLRVALDADAWVVKGERLAGAIRKLKKTGRYAEPLLKALSSAAIAERTETVRGVRVDELRTFMMLDEDVVTKHGQVIIPKGREINGALIERLRHFASGVGVVEPIRVRVVA